MAIASHIEGRERLGAEAERLAAAEGVLADSFHEVELLAEQLQAEQALMLRIMTDATLLPESWSMAQMQFQVTHGDRQCQALSHILGPRPWP